VERNPGAAWPLTYPNKHDRKRLDARALRKYSNYFNELGSTR